MWCQELERRPAGRVWRRLSPSAELMIDAGYGTRCAIRDIGAPGEGRYHWTVTVLGLNEVSMAAVLGELPAAAYQNWLGGSAGKIALVFKRPRTK
jgi:hypothetical protein